MQRSFSIVHESDQSDDDRDNIGETFDLKADLSHSDSEDLSPKKTFIEKKPEALPRRKSNAGQKPANSSDSEDSEGDGKKKLPGEYDPTQYENLVVDPEIAEIFQYIQRYTPQSINTEYKFKPFVPEFLPAVGDIDAFLKVIPPETTLAGDIFDENILQLGLLVLDEPASNQSDPALLHLQLRAASDGLLGGNEQKNIVVKKIDNLEKNSKVIDKWIKDISHLHKSKSSPVVRYSQPMPDIEDLMQQWPEDLEQTFKREGFPKPEENQPITEYIETVCTYLQIPVTKNKVQSLHLLFCLYTAIKQLKLYQNQAAISDEKKRENNSEKNLEEADQLVLE
ncbi:intraflagellar transport protein 46 homolog [Anthonomus grandis grandis]|uniref:intraflagellar transport protein 46 homolog n=1 Tax=Anthonomus grandis grandis TaxID=2921223 RepID=UPI002165509E|nr:intraflagellar transport protein 46 homolog [Anthonomus grandis grandis]